MGRLDTLTYPGLNGEIGETVDYVYENGTGMLAHMQSDLDGAPVYFSDADYNIFGQI